MNKRLENHLLSGKGLYFVKKWEDKRRVYFYDEDCLKKIWVNDFIDGIDFSRDIEKTVKYIKKVWQPSFIWLNSKPQKDFIYFKGAPCQILQKILNFYNIPKGAYNDFKIL